MEFTCSTIDWICELASVYSGPVSVAHLVSDNRARFLTLACSLPRTVFSPRAVSCAEPVTCSAPIFCSADSVSNLSLLLQLR